MRGAESLIKKMRKYFVAPAALVFAFVAFAGCGGGDSAPTWNDVVAVASPTVASPPVVDVPTEAPAATTASDEEDRLREERQRVITDNVVGELERLLIEVKRLCEAAGCLDVEGHADVAREMWLGNVVNIEISHLPAISADVQNAIRDLHAANPAADASAANVHEAQAAGERRELTANETGQLGQTLREVGRLCEVAGCLNAEAHADVAREMWLVEVVDGGLRFFPEASLNVQNAIRDIHGANPAADASTANVQDVQAPAERRALTANETGQLGQTLRDVGRLCEAAGCSDAESHADIAREMWLVEVVDGGMRRFSYVSSNVQNAIRDIHGD